MEQPKYTEPVHNDDEEVDINEMALMASGIYERLTSLSIVPGHKISKDLTYPLVFNSGPRARLGGFRSSPIVDASMSIEHQTAGIYFIKAFIPAIGIPSNIKITLTPDEFELTTAKTKSDDIPGIGDIEVRNARTETVLIIQNYQSVDNIQYDYIRNLWYEIIDQQRATRIEVPSIFDLENFPRPDSTEELNNAVLNVLRFLKIINNESTRA